MDIKKLDKNFSVNTDINEEDVVFYDVREEPFDVYGLYDYKNTNLFIRMPDDEAKKVSEAVHSISRRPAGGRVRFCTDSEYVAIDAKMTYIFQLAHFSLLGGAGFDLFEDDPHLGESYYRSSFMPPRDMTDGYTSKVKLGSKKLRYFTINLPTYSCLKSLSIGIQKDAYIGGGMRYRDIEPIVYYGSSITQGASASRPGNTYEAIVSRRLNVDHVNLGFSGNAKGEAAMAEYIATLPMSVFVCDYDHNATTIEHLQSTHRKFYEIVREARPELPIVLMSRCDVFNSRKQSEQRRDIIMDTYRYARDNGDQNIYFIDGAEIFRGPYEDMCTVDNVHPNDLGFALMADAVEAQIKQIFKER